MPRILFLAKAVVQILQFWKSFEESRVPFVFKVTKERLESTKNEIKEGHEEEFPTIQSKL
jgi:hypothetical protein